MKNEQGQAAVLVAIALIALLAMVGLAIDGGQLLALRRAAQNASDAAALAGTRELAQIVSNCSAGTPANDLQVWNAVARFAVQNGLDPQAGDALEAWYVDRNENRLGQVGVGFIPTGATGVTVILTRTQQTYFLQLVGSSQARAGSHSTAMAGPVRQFPGGVLPIAVPLQVVQSLSPGQQFVVIETNQQNGGMFCDDRNGNGRLDDGEICIGDPASNNAHRGWLNLNYIYNTDHLRRSDPYYRTFEQEVPNRPCGSNPNISTDDGLQGWASGECPYPFPLFAGDVGMVNGDFIHGDPGARQSSLMEVENYVGQTAYTPIFDYIYMSDYMAANFPPPEGIGWPRAGGGGHAFLYHIVGFTAIRVEDVAGHTLVGEFESAIIGEGAIQPGYGVGSGVCIPSLTHGVSLWR
ncbi:MAG: pilus assembly protein TadG-related protein [Anaerolineae bacterium]